MENLEKDVVKKTNKYVYLSNGTHMSHGDFHRYKQNIRNELSLIHAKEYKNSIEMITQSLDERIKLEEVLESLQDATSQLHYEIDSLKPHDWEKSFREERTRTDKITEKLNNHASKLYANLADLPILKNYTNDKGIKFIIQQSETDEHRFCFDPYELGANFHSQLSEFFRQNEWGTINGGWVKVIGNKVILYYMSGDYGVYDDNIAIDCAKKVFPNKTIVSFAGKQWEDDFLYDFL